MKAKHTVHTSIFNFNEVFGLIVGSYVSVTLLLIRMVFSGKMTHIYLSWNLFLAWIPFAVSLFLGDKFHRLKKHPVLLTLLSITWLFFFPNAPYVITDLKHLQTLSHIPFWFDLVLLSSFAFNGLYLGLFSLSHIQRVMMQYVPKQRTWFIILGISYLTGIGLYLGRVLRWNSWDILTTPQAIVFDTLSGFIHPIQNLGMHLFVLFSTIGLLTFYRFFFYVFFEKNTSTLVRESS